MVADSEQQIMARALELAVRGEGSVEPNPMVGCVIVKDGTVVGEGWHKKCGSPHAEVEALTAAGSAARRATMFVTLEPCCHHGKTAPCTKAILAADVARVVIAEQDPFRKVNGGGIRQLVEAGVVVEQGMLESSARILTAPYRKLITTGRPWVIAKWAMTLDGKIAARTGDSQWISNSAARKLVHAIRGRVDAILVGRGTAVADDPQLTARPEGPRIATRIVLDRAASLPLDGNLVRSAGQVPTLVVTGPDAPTNCQARLRENGCEVVTLEAPSRSEQLAMLFDELGRRQMTNLLIEGGGEVLGAALDAKEVDEVHVFVAPKLLGGAQAVVPFAGYGAESINMASHLNSLSVQELDGDVYLHGRTK
jgi:diaminohydroxyphosphoribosylaminopyrimidine deaminase/5-amino-6-(5-phosphoribosylamino)uracil reductase